MTIRAFVIDKEAKAFEERLCRLAEVGAPSIMVDRQREALAELKAGNINVGGNATLLDTEFTRFEVKTGRGGKSYVQFDGKVNYFPNAKYGRYIAEA